MNSVRRLTAVGALTIGTLGLGMPTTFAASLPNWSPCPPEDQCITHAPDEEAGDTTYNLKDRNYLIYDRKPDDGLAVGVKFYHPGQDDAVVFTPCNGHPIHGCSKNLPREIKGGLCMMTGTGNGNDANKYEYGDPKCFNADS